MKASEKARKAWAKVKRARTSLDKATAELMFALNEEEAEALGLKAADPRQVKRAPMTTYAAAMEAWGGSVANLLRGAPSAVSLLLAHPWTAANINDPREWYDVQRAKYPGVLSDDLALAELVKSLAWMHENRRDVGGRRDASRFLSRWVARAMERRRASPQRGMFAPPAEGATDLDKGPTKGSRR